MFSEGETIVILAYFGVMFLIVAPLFILALDGYFERLRKYRERRKVAKKVLDINLTNLDKRFKHEMTESRALYREVYQIFEDIYYQKREQAKKQLNFGLSMMERDYNLQSSQIRKDYMKEYWKIYSEWVKEIKGIKPQLKSKWALKRTLALWKFETQKPKPYYSNTGRR